MIWPDHKRTQEKAASTVAPATATNVRAPASGRRVLLCEPDELDDDPLEEVAVADTSTVDPPEAVATSAELFENALMYAISKYAFA